jgi:aryl-alcohol dehydrogenase-like predicted oxidoreductase
VRNLILGSAQFGNGYGSYVNSPKLNTDEIYQILYQAKLMGIKYIDTALSYSGVIQKISGFSHLEYFDIGTKIEYNCKTERQLTKDLYKSLSELSRFNFTYILVHNWATLSIADKYLAIKYLGKLREIGITLKIGISVYDTSELKAISTPIDIVQAPLNYFNINFLFSPSVKKMKDHGTEFHARSIFHQGLLLQPSLWPLKFSTYLTKFEKYCSELQHSNLQAALSVYDSQTDFSRLVIGVSSESNLLEIADCPIYNRKLDLSGIKAEFPPEFIDPRLWDENL